ncbi:MAG TPA: thermosome subunit beta [Candidatus Thermoplasmatota archaeon]
MLPAGTQILVLKEGTERSTGRGAQSNNIAAAIAIADAVRSTLGPRGMDKMLVDSMGDVTITNDGVTILKEIDVSHPAAKMIVEVAKVQDDECGDGTTTSVILAGELLKKAQDLIDSDVHPTVVTEGYRLASNKAVEVLESISKPVKANDKEALRNISMTALASKLASSNAEFLSDLCVRAIGAVSEERNGKTVADSENVLIVKKTGGAVADTEYVEGIILDKEPVHAGMPKVIEGARIAIVDSALEIKKTEVEAKIEIHDPSSLGAFLAEEESTLKKMVEKVADSGANVLVCQKGIDDLAQHYLAKRGIYAVRRVKKSDMEKLAKASGGSIVTKLDDLTKSALGKAERIECRKIAGDELTFITGCKGAKSVSLLVRGGTEHVVDEIERSIHDALSVVSDTVEDGRLVAGGGATAIELSKQLREYASTVGGREQLAVQAFAEAFEVIPRALAENAGLDPIDVLINIRKAHADGRKNHGVNVFTGQIVDMSKAHVVEPIRVGRQAITSAVEAAVMILRIDDVIASKAPSKDDKEGGPGGGMGGMGGMPPGMGGMM